MRRARARARARVRDHPPAPDDVLRVCSYSPVALEAGDIKRFHGVDERISIDSYVRQHAFYARVMEDAAWK